MPEKKDISIKQCLENMIVKKINDEQVMVAEITKAVNGQGRSVVSEFDTSRHMAQMDIDTHNHKIAKLLQESEMLTNPALELTGKNIFSLIDLSVNYKKTMSVVLSPVMGGSKVEINKEKVTIVTPYAQMGRALVNANVNDEFNINNVKYKVLAIQSKSVKSR